MNLRCIPYTERLENGFPLLIYWKPRGETKPSTRTRGKEPVLSSLFPELRIRLHGLRPHPPLPPLQDFVQLVHQLRLLRRQVPFLPDSSRDEKCEDVSFLLPVDHSRYLINAYGTARGT